MRSGVEMAVINNHSHHPDDIAERIKKGPDHSYLKDVIYGAIDGTVTTFAVVAGVAGADLSHKITIILGLANLLADGFSMAVSNFLGTRAEQQRVELIRQTEHQHIRDFPEGEKEEIRQIFAQKGFKGKDLENAVEVITKSEERWVQTMIQDEFGLSLSSANPWKAGLATFAAFFVAGMIPLLAFVINLVVPNTAVDYFATSAILTGLTFFIIGSMKGVFVLQPWWKSGFETLLVGLGASLLAYYVGYALKIIVL